MGARGRAPLVPEGGWPGRPHRPDIGAGSDYGPAWSPDGKWIAFLRQMEPTQFALFIITPVGGTPLQVADVDAYLLGVLRRPYRRLDWTRDSRHLIVSAFGGRGSAMERLLLVSVESRAKTWLTEPVPDVMFGDREPAVSPDGKMVAFVRGAIEDEALYVAPLTPDLRLGVARPVADGQGVWSPTWMPDGRRLLVMNLKPGGVTGFALAWFDLDSAKPLRNLPVLEVMPLRFGFPAGPSCVLYADLGRNYLAAGDSFAGSAGSSAHQGKVRRRGPVGGAVFARWLPDCVCFGALGHPADLELREQCGITAFRSRSSTGRLGPDVLVGRPTGSTSFSNRWSTDRGTCTLWTRMEARRDP